MGLEAPSAGGAAWLLFDARSDKGEGGTGATFDWRIIEAASPRRPFFLAGGLHAENVASAIATTRPDAIDVSSGVEEAPGIKSAERIRKLFATLDRLGDGKG